MRERSTWNKTQIIKNAFSREAEDPRAMNQDHLSQQPAADAYVIGGPSDFAEDVAPSDWKAEYEGGTTRRNEIGLPEFRTASEDDEDADDGEDEDFLKKKADFCLKMAARMLPKTASVDTIEDQAFDLMHMPDSFLRSTARRLAAEQQQQDDDAQQGKQAQQQQQADDSEKDQGKQAQQQQSDEDQGQQGKQAQQQQDQGSDDAQQGKQAQQQQQQSEEDQTKQACEQVLAQGNMQVLQQAIQQMVQQAFQTQLAQQQQSAPAAQQVQSQQVQQEQSIDDQLLDDMLQAPQQGQEYVASLDVELAADGGGMDLTASDATEDERLNLLFASHHEVREASQIQAAQTGIRTAATRTIGTRPTGGVSQLGGGTNVKTASDMDKLSGLWSAPPDVSDVFR